MCRFISIAVEDKDAAKRIFAGYSLSENENPSFKKEIPEHYQALWVTDSLCSCAFYMEPYDPKSEAEKLIKKVSKPKYKKKGWSKEKIEREVAQLLGRPKAGGGLSKPLFECVRVYAKTCGDCYWHIGRYAGDQTKEGVRIMDRVVVELGSDSVEAEDIDENVLYRFTS